MQGSQTGPSAVAQFFKDHFQVSVSVFDTRRGDREGEEYDKVLAFFPTTAAVPVRCSIVGLAQAVTSFASTFSEDSGIRTLDADVNKWIMFEAEPHIWFLMVIKKSWVGTSCCNEGLKSFLHTLYLVFTLLHGKTSALLEQDPTGHSLRRVLQPLIEESGSRLTQLSTKELAGLANPLGPHAALSVPLIPTSQAAFLAVQCMVNQLLVSTFYGSRLVSGALVLWQHQASALPLWTSLQPQDTAALTALANKALLPAVRTARKPRSVLRPLTSSSQSAAATSNSVTETLLCPAQWQLGPSPLQQQQPTATTPHHHQPQQQGVSSSQSRQSISTSGLRHNGGGGGGGGGMGKSQGDGRTTRCDGTTDDSSSTRDLMEGDRGGGGTMGMGLPVSTHAAVVYSAPGGIGGYGGLRGSTSGGTAGGDGFGPSGMSSGSSSPRGAPGYGSGAGAGSVFGQQGQHSQQQMGGGQGRQGQGQAATAAVPVPPQFANFLVPRLRPLPPRNGTAAMSPLDLFPDPAIPMARVWLQASQEWALLLPYCRGPLLLLLLLNHDSQSPSAEVLEALAGVLAVAPVMQMLHAEIPQYNLWHRPGYRYSFVDHACYMSRFTPGRKVLTLSTGCQRLMAELRNRTDMWHAADFLPGAGSDASTADSGSGGAMNNNNSNKHHCEEFEDAEVVVRSAGDCWLVVRRAGRRVMYVAFEQPAEHTLPAVGAKVTALCDAACPGVFV